MMYAVLQKQLNILDYALSSLYRKRMKSCGVILVFAAVIFLFSSLQLMNRGLQETARELLQEAPDIVVQQMSAGRQVHIDTAVVARIQEIFGVTGVEPRLWGYYFDESNGANYTVIGKTFGPGSTEHQSSLSWGGYPVDGQSGEVVVSEYVHDSLQLQGRRSFSWFRPDLTLKSFTVSGHFAPESSLATADLAVMSMEDARDLFMIAKGQVTDIMVTVGNPLETETIAAKIAELLPGTRVISRNQILKTYSVVFSWRSGIGAVCMLAALVAFAILAYDKASGLSQDDLREVGILKLLGWHTGDVMAVRFWESGSISLLALAAGYGLAWLHVTFWHGVLFAPLLLGWSVLRPGIDIVPSFALEDLLLVAAVSVVPYLCATIVPAWRSATVRPDSVM